MVDICCSQALPVSSSSSSSVSVSRYLPPSCVLHLAVPPKLAAVKFWSVAHQTNRSRRCRLRRLPDGRQTHPPAYSLCWSPLLTTHPSRCLLDCLLVNFANPAFFDSLSTRFIPYQPGTSLRQVFSLAALTLVGLPRFACPRLPKPQHNKVPGADRLLPDTGVSRHCWFSRHQNSSPFSRSGNSRPSSATRRIREFPLFARSLTARRCVCNTHKSKEAPADEVAHRVAVTTILPLFSAS